MKMKSVQNVANPTVNVAMIAPVKRSLKPDLDAITKTEDFVDKMVEEGYSPEDVLLMICASTRPDIHFLLRYFFHDLERRPLSIH